MIKKLKNKLLISRKMLFLASVSFVLVFLTVAFIYIQKTSALGGSIFNNSLIISDFSPTPNVLAGTGIIWNDSSVSHTNDVNFNVSVRGRSGVINYNFWSNCPGYDPNTIYNTASLQTVCNKIADHSSATITSSSWQNKAIPFTYAQAGNYKPVILVERNGVFMHKSMDISFKPKVNLSVEYSDDASFNPAIKPVASAGDVVFNGTEVINNISYNQYARLNYNFWGMPNGSSCTATTTGVGAPSWTGLFSPGTSALNNMPGGSFVYKMKCDYNGASGEDQITLNVSPGVKLQAIAGATSATAINKETIDLGTITAGIPLNTSVTINGWTTGADRCTLSGAPSGLITDSPLNTNFSSQNTEKIVYSDIKSTGINGTSTITLKCFRTIGATTLDSTAIIRVYSSSGNCAFKGNNTIQATTFCKNSLVTLNGADNIQMTGSFVAKSFSIDSVSDNIRFFYDYNTGDKIPPGFKYLNIPSPKEVGNTGD